MIGTVRRDASTVVAVVGEVREQLLAALNRSPNVTLARPLRRASGSPAPYVLVPADPLAGVAGEWQAMWDVSQGQRGDQQFEARAREALDAWRSGRFELPDYYLVLARADADTSAPDTRGPDSRVPDGRAPDAYLGPIRAVRPRRVAVVPAGEGPAEAARVLDALRTLPHGPWWPPLDELIASIRRFYAGGLGETPGQ
jgi:hypothetical protein